MLRYQIENVLVLVELTVVHTENTVVTSVRPSIRLSQLRTAHFIEDVERGAELSFSGLRVRFADPPRHHRQILGSQVRVNSVAKTLF